MLPVNDKASFLRVGLLLLAAIGAAIGLVLFLGRGQVSHGVSYESYFRESVQGLDVGSAVKFRGVTLGQVDEIGLVSAAYAGDQPGDLDSAPSRLVLVRFEIDPSRLGRVPDAARMVRQGLRVRLAAQGFTGLAYLELDFVDPQKFPATAVPWTPREAVIPSMPSVLNQVQDAAQLLLAKLDAIDLDRLATTGQAVFDELHRQLAPGGDAQQTLEAAAGLLHTLDQAVAKSDLPGLVADLRATSATLRGVAGGRQTQQLLATATRAADQLSIAAARLPPLIATLQTAVGQAGGDAADVTAGLGSVLRDARAAAANLRDTTETLRRYPSSVLLGGPPPRDGAR